MEYVNLSTGVGTKVEKSKILLVLKDVIDANNGNVDMSAIAAKHRLNRQERRAIEDYLKKYMVFESGEVYKSYKDLAEGLYKCIENDLIENNSKETETTQTGIGPISISLLQRRFELGYPAAAKIIERLDECGLLMRTPDKRLYFNLGTPNTEK